MRISPEQLGRHLNKPLLPVYLVTGDEPLQAMEAMDALRAAARQQGYTMRELMFVDRGFNWAQLSSAAASLSLFADKRILELRLEGSGPGKDGGQALVEYAERPAEDAVLLISMGKLDQRSQSTRWFKAIDQIGGVIQVWPKKPAELPGWLQQRLRSRGLELDREAVSLLATRIEGNMLAAAQEIEKLALLHGQTSGVVTLSIREVAASVADS
ncbi:MAG: DNA polymerase III subunit delta, partial [Gammaproteobacteria bacterium]|nr:DNA polymerase III subunit delta [Gammaproteobacteria bacterium]